MITWLESIYSRVEFRRTPKDHRHMVAIETLDDVANLLRPHVISIRKGLCLGWTPESEQKVNLSITIVYELSRVCVGQQPFISLVILGPKEGHATCRSIQISPPPGLLVHRRTDQHDHDAQPNRLPRKGG